MSRLAAWSNCLATALSSVNPERGTVDPRIVRFDHQEVQIPRFSLTQSDRFLEELNLARFTKDRSEANQAFPKRNLSSKTGLVWIVNRSEPPVPTASSIANPSRR